MRRPPLLALSLLMACSSEAELPPPGPAPTTMEPTCQRDCPAVVLDTTGSITIAEGATRVITARLVGAPSGPVTLLITSSDAISLPLRTSALLLRAGEAQSFTLSNPSDTARSGERSVTISYAITSEDRRYAALVVPDLEVRLTDDEVAGFSLEAMSQLQTSEAGGQATFKLSLTIPPTDDVEVVLSSSDPTEGSVSPSSLLFLHRNWRIPQTITVTGVNDQLRDGDVRYEIRGRATSGDAAYEGLQMQPQELINVDDDRPELVFDVHTVITQEGGATASVLVRLDAAPTAEVDITLASSDPAEATVRPARLRFGPSSWATPQTIEISGVDDGVLDGTRSYWILTGTASSDDPGWSGRDPRDLLGLNLDDEARSPDLVRVSVDERGRPGAGPGRLVDLSWDGRLVVFSSEAPDLAPGDTNGGTDVFLRDLALGRTIPVSVDAAGALGSAASNAPQISGDGRFVLFHSSATLTDTPTRGFEELYLRDLAEESTTLISRHPGGMAFADSVVDAAISYDGRYIALQTSVFRAPGSNPQWDVWIHDRRLGGFVPGVRAPDGSEPDLGTRWPRLSADGRVLAFVSAASNLVAGDTNGVDDVFVRDLDSGAIERVSEPGIGGNDRGRALLRPALSGDGMTVAFATWATLLPEDLYATADVYVRDRRSGALEVIQLLSGTPPSSISLSADGRYVLIATTSDAIDLDHPQAANGRSYPVVYDRQRRSLTRLLYGSATGIEAVAMSGDGRSLAFTSEDPALAPPGSSFSDVYWTPQPIR